MPDAVAVSKCLASQLRKSLHRSRDEQPGVVMMDTYSALANAPMLSINTRLGFVRHKETGTYQIGPDALAAYLVSRTPRHDA